MKQKKKDKKYKLAKKIAQQHSKDKRNNSSDAYASFSSLDDIKTFFRQNKKFLVLVALIVFALYFNTLDGAFVSDDVLSYQKNPRIRNFTEAAKEVHWQNMMYFIVYSLFENSPIPLHTISVTLHILSLTVFFLFISNFFSKKVAMFSTLIFAVHPLASESVSWISGNNYLVYSIFTFSMAISYIMYRNSHKRLYLYASVGIFSFITLFTHAAQIMSLFPVIILVDQFLIEKKLTFKTAKDLALYLIPVVLFLMYFFTIDSQHVFGRIASTTNVRSANYTEIFPYAVYMPIRLMIFPDNLTLYHDAEIITTALLTQMRVVALLVIALVIYLLKKNRKMAGLILIAGASSFYMFSPIQIAWFFAERYVYLGVAMFSVLLVLTLFAIEKKTKLKNFSLIVTTLLFIAFSVRTFIRTNDWKTRKSLWEATAKVVPLSARTYNNLGDVYAVEGDMQASVTAFSRAIELDPTYDAAAHNLGLTYLKMGELEKAEENFIRSLELNPGLYQAYFHLGLIELQRQNYESVKQYTQKALEINPQHKPALLLLQKLDELEATQ